MTFANQPEVKFMLCVIQHIFSLPIKHRTTTSLSDAITPKKKAGAKPQISNQYKNFSVAKFDFLYEYMCKPYDYTIKL